MINLHNYIGRELKIRPEQVQVFIPAPSTYSALMYYTEQNPFTGEKIFVEKKIKNRDKQKKLITK